MQIYITGNDYENRDLNICNAGYEDCEPGHFYGPAVRDFYLIHYIFSGKGVFKTNGNSYNLSVGNGFLISPGNITFYKADIKDPWAYSWVGFRGKASIRMLDNCDLSLNNPIFSYNEDDYIKNCFKEIYLSHTSNISGNTIRLGYTYLFLSKLTEQSFKSSTQKQVTEKNRYTEYIQKVLKFIEINYYRRISVEEIASHIGLDRSYLGSLFKKYTQKSIQKYLLDYRMNRACELLEDINLSVGSIGRSVGYEDQMLFSKMFKSVIGISPSVYREKF